MQYCYPHLTDEETHPHGVGQIVHGCTATPLGRSETGGVYVTRQYGAIAHLLTPHGTASPQSTTVVHLDGYFVLVTLPMPSCLIIIPMF